MIKIAINGYGRIGRIAHRVILEKFADKVKVAAINGTAGTDIRGWANLLKYDTAYGPLTSHTVNWKGGQLIAVEDTRHDYVPREAHDFGTNELGHLIIDDEEIPFFAEKDPSKLPWKELDIDVVIESTGHFTTAEKIKPHLDAGAKRVVLSAPVRGGGVKTVVLGVNLSNLSDLSYLGKLASGDLIISNASCTTNCVAPVAQVMSEKFGVKKAMVTTIHAYTSDQRLQDGSHKDYRRARAAASNIVPTTTGATIAATEAVPELKGLFAGLAIRVPVIAGSLSDFTFLLERPTTVEEINSVFRTAAKSARYSGILAVTDDPLVSSDIVGSSFSSIVDLSLTQVVDGDMVKVVAWYDNEWGYAVRLVEEVILVGRQI